MRRQTFLRITYGVLTIVLLSLTLASTAWAAEYKAIYKFKGGQDGREPHASLILDGAGNLYGTTFYGGHQGCGDGCGTVYKLSPNPNGSWTEKVLHSFSPADKDGASPYGGLIFDAEGNLYGTTVGGGLYGGGTVFRLTPNPDGSWTETLLHSFWGGRVPNDGYNPYSGLTFDAAGNLYGTTQRGGLLCYGDDFGGCGTVFKLTSNPDGSWTHSVLRIFGGDSGQNGAYPMAGVTIGPDGSLYGTTTDGGDPHFCDYSGCGTVWMPDRVKAFKGTNGAWPYGGVVFDAQGNLYGTTSMGGLYDAGTVFKMSHNPDGSWTRGKVHFFKVWDGAGPYGNLIFDGLGSLYGTTVGGGPYNSGVVFKLTPQPDGTWKFTKLHAFEYSQWPYAGLVIDAAGNLYGATSGGGYGHGVVFKITP